MFDKLTCIAGVDVWYADLDAQGAADNDNLLSAAERDKAARFATETLRRRYVASRRLLRAKLAGYTDCPEQALRFDCNEYGKPFLPEHPDVAFNLSHSERHLLLAVAQGGTQQIGIDIESWRERIGFEGLVQRCFALSEQRYWENLPTAQRCAAFYALWTQKEAFVKAVGRGIAIGLEHCVLATDGNPRLLQVPENCGQPDDWQVWPLLVGERLSAALVYGNAGQVFGQP